MLRKKNFVALATYTLVCISITAHSQDSTEAKAFTFSGSVDGYYKFDFDKTAANSFTSFTQTHNSFSLGMASVKIEHKKGKVSAVADLGFGPRARDFSYADEGITQAIKQLYVSYSPADWATFTLGTWATHVGYEVLDPQLNRNYSMSYMFTNGPFSHTGFKANFTAGKHGLMLGVSNPTDLRIPPKDHLNKKFFLAQYSLSAGEATNIFINYVGGKAPDTSKTSQVDAVVISKLSNKFTLGFNGTIATIKGWDGLKNSGSSSWWGSAIYLNFDPKENFGLTLRSELFNDEDQLKTFSGSSIGGTIFSNTLSANFKLGGLIIIPELRVDKASEEVLFIDKDGLFRKASTSFLVAAVYSF
jgi:hypothetical protein